ncbi:hypothetical protein GCM10027289_07270 [Tsukamurella serpentis]
MNGERQAADDGSGEDQIFARPAWLADFRTGDDGRPGGRDGGRGGAERDQRGHTDGDGDAADWTGESLEPPPRGVRADEDFWDPEPTGWRATVDKVRTTPRAAIALIAVGVVAAVVAAVAVFGGARGADSGPYPVVNFTGAAESAGRGSSAASYSASSPVAAPSVPAAPPDLVVAVVGLVRSPGLHRLRPGARIADALAAARGALGGADTASLNLAQPVRDGDQIVVGVVDPKTGVKLRSSVLPGTAGGPRPSGGPAAIGNPGAATGSGVTSGASGGTPAALVNINTADAAELDKLPGVGAATATAIITHRDKNGPFRSVDDLAKVGGIGAAKLAKIKPLATV